MIEKKSRKIKKVYLKVKLYKHVLTFNIRGIIKKD